MLGFLVLVFIYLFILLARNTEKPGRSSLVRSLVLAGVFIFLLSLFSLVTFGVLFLFLLFIPFFFLPSGRFKGGLHSRNQENLNDFFEHLRNQERFRQSREHARSSPIADMSIQEAAALFGVSVDATPLQIKTAYRKLMLKHHPDKGGSAEYAAKLNMARDVLMAKYK